jgi:hypothetical protein
LRRFLRTITTLHGKQTQLAALVHGFELPYAELDRSKEKALGIGLT